MLQIIASMATRFGRWRSYGPIPDLRRAKTRPLSRGPIAGPSHARPANDSHSRLEHRARSEFPDVKPFASKLRHSDMLWPRRCFVREFRSGSFMIRRTEVRPFTDKQIALLKTFADSGSHRHRERAVVQGIAGAQRRIARGPGASDGNC